MKKLIQTIFAVIAFLAIATEAHSQNKGSAVNYTTSLGVRLGSDNGVTFKHFYRPTWAFEGTITTGYRALVGTALIEKHISINKDNNLQLFFGGGGHIGQWGYISYYRYTTDNGTTTYRRYESVPSIGADGIFGIEYKFPDAPFTIGADIKPFVDIFYPTESSVDGGFSVRYVFN
jgi:hypothetical protein